MTEHEFADLLGGIDPALIARAEAPLPLHKKPHFRRALIAATAALLAMTMLLGMAVIALIPKTYDLDYEIPEGERANTITQIYYTTENGRIKFESVLLPPTPENVYVTWAHRNGVGDEVLFSCSPVSLLTAPPDRLWARLLGIEHDSRGLKVTLSEQMASYPDHEALIESLKKTLAAYMGIPSMNVFVTIEDVNEVQLRDFESAFREFLDTYDFATASDAEFRASLLNLTHQGKNLFDIMLPTPTEYQEGFDGAEYTSLLFSYKYLYEIDVQKSIEFTAKALPDGMVLPYGITDGDSLIDALCKYGYTREQSQKTAQEKINGIFTAPDGGMPVLYLKCYDTHFAFEYQYSGNVSMEIRYRTDDLGFDCLKITTFIERTDPDFDDALEWQPPELLPTEFRAFMEQHGFIAADPADFRKAIEQFSRRGENLFDVIGSNTLEPQYGYEGERYSNYGFVYGYLRSPNGACNNYFVIRDYPPDGVTLPHGISLGDTLLEALCKMGMNQYDAQFLIEQAKELPYALDASENSIPLAIGDFTFCLKRLDSTEYCILYSFTGTPLADHFSPPEYRLEIAFAQDKMYFDSCSITTEYALGGSVTTAPADALDSGKTLSDEDAAQLTAILNQGTWEAGSLEWIERECDYYITIGDVLYRYSSDYYVICGTDHYLSLTVDQRNTVDQILGKYVSPTE